MLSIVVVPRYAIVFQECKHFVTALLKPLFVLDQKLGKPLRLHEAAFQQMGGVPEEILYEHMKTVWPGTDERGEIVWHLVFSGLYGLLGLHAAPVPTVSRPNERESGSGREVRAAEFSVWSASNEEAQINKMSPVSPSTTSCAINS
jgi:hypothetical protein